MLCNEILFDLILQEWVVCEAIRFTEHMHGEWMPYMRPLREGERMTKLDNTGCIYLENKTC